VSYARFIETELIRNAQTDKNGVCCVSYARFIETNSTTMQTDKNGVCGVSYARFIETELIHITDIQ
jgi:hypothetical protein